MATSRLASAVEGVHSGDSGQVSGHVGALPVTTSEVLIGPEALMNHAGALDSLLKVTHAPATARWLPVVTWMRHNPMQTPWSVLVRRDGEVVAAALLVRVFRRGVYRFETPCEGYLPSWLPSRDAHSAKALAVALARSLPRYVIRGYCTCVASSLPIRPLRPSPRNWLSLTATTVSHLALTSARVSR